jgi:iron complex transport system substrate-binding protein
MHQTSTNSDPSHTANTPPRVVSLLPAATEILCSIGGRALLVARSHECDFPAGLEHLPVLTAQRIHSTDTVAIDHAVRDHLKAGEPLYTLDETRLRDLAPDVILTQDLCDVCSIDLKTVERLAQTMTPRPKVVSLNPQGIEDILDDLLRVGQAVGLESQAQAAMVDLRGRFHRAVDFTNPYADPIPVAFLEWTNPLFVAGHWTVQMLERAGASHPLNPTRIQDNAGAAAGPQVAQRVAGKSFRVTPEQLMESAPEFIFIAPCGFDMVATRAAAASLASQRWWRLLPAVRAHTATNPRVFLIDGNQMFNRPGPRLADAFEWLVAILQGRPDLMPQGFPAEPYPQA